MKLHTAQIDKVIRNLHRAGRTVAITEAVEMGKQLQEDGLTYGTAIEGCEVFKARIWNAGLVT